MSEQLSVVERLKQWAELAQDGGQHKDAALFSVAASLMEAKSTALREQAQRLAELESENERLQSDAIHICHHRCQRTACVLRRRLRRRVAELAEAREALERIADMCDVSDRCACGRPTGTAAVLYCARQALARQKKEGKADAASDPS